MENEHLNELTGRIIGAAIEVHRIMGPGLAEEVYELCLMKELELRSIKAVSQVRIPLVYKNHFLQKDYKLDILVEDIVILDFEPYTFKKKKPEVVL